MEPESGNERQLAPPAFGSTAALQLPAEDDFIPPPYVDQRLVEPETREEMVRGRLIHAAPAKPPHADRHTELDRVVGSHAASDYIASSDLLTRAGPRSDFATDTCVRRAGIDPRTGSRYLEELAFEIVNEQSMRHTVERAEDLTERGVRRIIAIFVKKGTICEWSPDEHRWVSLDLDGELSDPTLVRPVPLRALLDPTRADDAVIKALDAKRAPQLIKIRIETACKVLDIAIDGPRRHFIDRLDSSGLEALLAHLETERRWP